MPHRGDRDQFLPQFNRILKSQTLKPTQVEVIDYPPVSEDVDITPRYREGYSRMKDVDLIAFMEIDDYYTPTYLETKAALWKTSGKPDMIGLSYTIYYHLRINRYFKFEHFSRSSMMSTCIRPGLEVDWPKDIDPYTDLWIWKNNPEFEKKVVQPKEHLCIGMKHGIGMTGGEFHKTHLYRYKIDDINLSLLKSMMDKESLNFYSSLEIPSYKITP